jgi:peroxin-6
LTASPLFLHNLAGDSAPVVIRPSPFGSRPPSLPTANSVTVARVASPHSSDRAYQALFLHALKKYFETSMRLVKMGDLIAVGIRIEDARVLDNGGDSDASDNSTNDATVFLDHEWVGACCPSFRAV